MNTQEVANKWAQMCRAGKNLECVNELYAENVVSKEMPGIPNIEIVTGKNRVWKKTKAWLHNVKEFHSGELSDPIVAGNHFTSKLTYDVTYVDRGRQKVEEVCVFEVKDGKITHEQFFYSV